MDQADMERLLAQAEEHVAFGERNVARQRALVATLEGDNRGAAEAKRVLANFEDVQALQVADRDRFRRELAASGSGHGPWTSR